MAALSVSEAAVKSSRIAIANFVSSRTAESECTLSFLLVLRCPLLLLWSILAVARSVLLPHHHNSLDLAHKLTPAPSLRHNRTSNPHPSRLPNAPSVSNSSHAPKS